MVRAGEAIAAPGASPARGAARRGIAGALLGVLLVVLYLLPGWVPYFYVLAATQLPLDDVAAALGYAGVSPFTRAFRRRTGAAPGQWRREAKAGRVDAVELRGRSADAAP